MKVLPSLRLELLHLRWTRLFLLLDTGSDWLVCGILPPTFRGVCVFPVAGLVQTLGALELPVLPTASVWGRGCAHRSPRSLGFPLESSCLFPALLLLTGLGSRGQSHIDLLFCLPGILSLSSLALVQQGGEVKLFLWP